MRIYDPRVGRFLSVDPITSKYPELTPYQFASNTPIQAIDLDGLEAWVVYRDFYANMRKPKITMVFDKDLVNPGGVYKVNRWHNSTYPDYIESSQWMTVDYSEFPDEFPNNGRYENSISFEANVDILYGEAGFNLNKVAALEFGGEGKILSYNYSSKNGSSLSGPDDRNLNLGIGGAYYGVGLEYRHKFDLVRGRFKKENSLSASYNPLMLPVGMELEADTYSKNSNMKIGIPELKLALGLGAKGGAYFNIYKPKLTSFESIEQAELNKKETKTKYIPDFSY